MITGRSPLLETRERIKRLSPRRYKEVVPITNLEAGLPHRVVILVNRLMDLDPEKRPQTPGMALRDIESVIEAIESGQDTTYDPQSAADDAARYEQMTRRENEGQGKAVMVIESNVRVQDALREKLKAHGYRPLIISDPQRGLSRFLSLDPAEERPAECVIFSCAGLGYEGIQAFNLFADNEDTQSTPTILLLPENLKKGV